MSEQLQPMADATDLAEDVERGVTVRSVALGIGVVAFINLWVTYAETVVKTSRLNLSVFQITLLAVFILLVGGLNPLIKSVNRRFALAPGELLAVVAIGIVGCVVFMGAALG